MLTIDEIKQKALGCGFAVNEFQPATGAINCEIVFDSLQCCCALTHAFPGSKLAEIAEAFVPKYDVAAIEFDDEFPGEWDKFHASDTLQAMELELLSNLVNAMKELLLAAAPLSAAASNVAVKYLELSVPDLEAQLQQGGFWDEIESLKRADSLQDFISLMEHEKREKQRVIDMASKFLQ